MFLFSIFPGSAVGEELGWRGFALPHLQAWRSALGASLILGAIWGLWHLPLWFTGSEFQRPVLYPAFFISTVAVSVIYTWMYNGTKGSLLIVVLFHATSNLPLTLFLTPMGSAGTQIFLIYVALTVMTAVVVFSVSRPENLSRTYPKQIASPADDIPHLRPTAQL